MYPARSSARKFNRLFALGEYRTRRNRRCRPACKSRCWLCAACAGVVHRQPAGGLQLPARNTSPRASLRNSSCPPISSRIAHAASKCAHDTDRPQLLHQPWHGDLTLMVLRQHEAAQLRPEVARHASRQRRDHCPPIRQNPALAPIADEPDPQHKLLHHEIIIALEARTGWNLNPNNLLLDTHPRRQFATPATLATSR